MTKGSGSFHVPGEGECLSLLGRYGTPPHVIRHCQAVCNVAVSMARGLMEKGHGLDLNVVRAAALLHDIARLEKDHAKAGADYVTGLGIDPRVGAAIAHHMDLPQVQGLTEAAIVYLADKLVQEDREVSLEGRFAPALEKAPPEGRQSILRRYEAARMLLSMVNEALKG